MIALQQLHYWRICKRNLHRATAAKINSVGKESTVTCTTKKHSVSSCHYLSVFNWMQLFVTQVHFKVLKQCRP